MSKFGTIGTLIVAAFFLAAFIAIASLGLPPVDAPISTIAAVILEQAKAEYPNDKVLEALKLDAHITWTTLLAAMEAIHGGLPPSWEQADKPTTFS